MTNVWDIAETAEPATDACEIRQMMKAKLTDYQAAADVLGWVLSLTLAAFKSAWLSPTKAQMSLLSQKQRPNAAKSAAELPLSTTAHTFYAEDQSTIIKLKLQNGWHKHG